MGSRSNAFRKKMEKGEYNTDLVAAVGDLQWYRKVREIRTECVHHSTIFIGEEKGEEPIMVVHALRRSSDKEEFPSEIQVAIPELLKWIKRALIAIDSYGDYLLKTYIIPSFPPNDQVFMPKCDRSGMLILLPDGRCAGSKITVREYLERSGICFE
jgi:hypothetical protein